MFPCIHTNPGLKSFFELTSELSYSTFKAVVSTLNKTDLPEEQQAYIQNLIETGNFADPEFVKETTDIYLLQALLRNKLTLSELTTMAVFQGAFKDLEKSHMTPSAERVPLFNPQDQINKLTFDILHKSFTETTRFSYKGKGYSCGKPMFENVNIHSLSFLEKCSKLSKKDQQFLIINDPMLTDEFLDSPESASFSTYMTLSIVNFLGSVKLNQKNVRIVPSFGMIQVALQSLKNTQESFPLEAVSMLPKLGLSHPFHMLEDGRQSSNKRPFAITLLNVEPFSKIHGFKGSYLGALLHDVYHGGRVALIPPPIRKAFLSLANSLLLFKPQATRLEKKEYFNSLEEKNPPLFKFINHLIDLELGSKSLDLSLYFFYFLLQQIVACYPIDSLSSDPSLKNVMSLVNAPHFLKKYNLEIKSLKELQTLLEKTDAELAKLFGLKNPDLMRRALPFFLKSLGL